MSKLANVEEMMARLEEHREAIKKTRSPYLRADRVKAIRKLEREIEEMENEEKEPADKFPKCCRKDQKCFAVQGGRCQILTDTKFNGRACPFFKTKEKHIMDQAAAVERMRINSLL